jgi:4-amino-4-deoxy-L-arabinose transferase-like glycosyltransferase
LGKRRLLIVVGVACAAFVAISLPALLIRSPLGHDESVYALRASNLLDGWTFRSGDYWRDYRAPGLPVMLSFVGRVTGVHVSVFRFVVVALGAATIAATFAVGKMLRGWTVGVGAALAMMLTSGFLLASTTLLADVPGAAFAMIAIAAYVHDVRQGRLHTSFVIVPIACFASTLSRFGTPFMLGAGLIATAVVDAPEIVARRNVRLALQSGALATMSAQLWW